MVPTPAAALGVVIPYNSAWSLAWTTSYNSAGSLAWHVCETRACLAWSRCPWRCWGWLYPIRLRCALAMRPPVKNFHLTVPAEGGAGAGGGGAGGTGHSQHFCSTHARHGAPVKYSLQHLSHVHST